MSIEGLTLKGYNLPLIQLAFRKPPYGKEQAHYDPLVGLRMYGPYKAVNVNILHIKIKQWSDELSSEIFEALSNLISNILDEYLKKAGARVKIEDEELDSLKDIISEDHDLQKRIVGDLESIVNRHKDSVILAYLPRHKLGSHISEKIYAKIKALGLQIGFITQLYSKKVVDATKKHVKKEEDSESYGAILRNISLNILAKAGGIPWALYNELEYDIVIGLSWSLKKLYEYSTGPAVKYYGVVHTFSRIGVWEAFKAFICGSKEKFLLDALWESLNYIIKTDLPRREIKYRRVLIMTRERLKSEYLESLSKHLKDEYGYSLDVAMVSTHIPVRMYDLSVNTYLVPSGLYFFESEESAYIVTTGRRRDVKYTGIGVPKPVRVSVLYSSDGKFEALRRTLKATYALTAMNWRSFWGSLRLPTPIHYSKLVARSFLLMEEVDIKNAFVKHGDYLYKPQKYEDRPWFI